MTNRHIVIGTRGSDLAVVQTEMVAEVLRVELGLDVELRVIKTQGDRATERPLREMEEAGFFTREIEDALSARSIDLAVHSHKDLPLQSPPGLVIAAVTKRDEPGDLLIIRPDAYSEGEALSAQGVILPLHNGAVVGTGSPRRQALLHAIRPDLKVQELRGNVATRLDKLVMGECDAVVVVAGGMRRLGLDLSQLKTIALDPTKFVPAPGQGALAIQVRVDSPLRDPVRKLLHDAMTDRAVALERGVLEHFGGGSSLPLGVYARWGGERWEIFGFWGGEHEVPVWAKVKGAEEEEE